MNKTKLLYIPNDRDWTLITKAMLDIGITRDLGLEPTGLSIYDCKHIGIYNMRWYAVKHTTLRHSCITVDADWIAEMQLTTFDREVFKVWLLNQLS